MTNTKNNWRLAAAGTRERYAMGHVQKSIEQKIVDGHHLFIYHYPTSDPYQDANGATWDDTDKRWVN